MLPATNYHPTKTYQNPSAWSNGSVEEQAMDRVHHIGRTKPVRVVRMVSANSVEIRILEIQEAKQALGMGALRKVMNGWINKGNNRTNE